MVTPIDFIIYYHSQKLRMINSVYFYSIYMSLHLFLTLGVLLKVIVHVFYIH